MIRQFNVPLGEILARGSMVLEKSDLLQGKVAVVTGAARGIGRAAAVAFAKQGADVIGLDICGPLAQSFGVTPSTPADLEQTEKEVKGLKQRFLSLILDQRDLQALKAAAVKIELDFGRLDIVFANAGVQGFKSLLEMEDIDWHTHIDVNLTGTANVIRAFSPLLVKQGGSIIITSSTQGQHGTKNGSAYSASKWGLLGLMKSAALELGKYNIRVNALIPGLINTALTRHEERYAQIIQEAGKQPSWTPEDEEEARNILIAKTPLGIPWIEPEEIAEAAVFLASDSAKRISGAEIEVTGGDSAHNIA